MYRFLQKNTAAIAEFGGEMVGARGGKDDGNMRMVLGEAFEGLPTVFGQHVQVQQSEVNGQFVGESKDLPPAGGGP